MRKQVTYICDYCGKIFTNALKCEEHEHECNKCNHCKHAYWIYGYNFACKYNNVGQCGVHKNGNYNYPNFENNEE